MNAPFNIAQHLLLANQARADKAAFVDDASTLTYGDLEVQVRQMASALLNAGVRREERILLLAHDCNAWPVAFLGALYAGVIPVAVNTLLTAQDYAFMLENSRARAAVVSHTLLPTLQAAMALSPHEIQLVIVANAPGDFSATSALTPFSTFVGNGAPLAAPAPTHPDEPAFWLYSSGSTGKPKGTVHSHANVHWTCELYAKPILGLRENDVCFSAAKLFFAYGLGNGLTFPMSVGATTVLMAERPTPDAVFKRFVEQQPTVFFGAPTGFAGMLASPNLPARAQTKLRLASSAGEALPAELGQKFGGHFGIEVIDGIGSTEMLHIFLSNQPGKVRYGTTGWPVPGYTIELRGDDGLALPENPDGSIDTGDLFIHGPSAALMYWANREKTRETFQGAWTKSGDKYTRNSDGSYTYSGRSDDMLKVSGIYVSPFEVEATLMQHSAVLEAAVIGVNDAQGLTKTKAFVVLKHGQACTEDELKAFVKDRLAPFKYPRQITFIEELPKTATGKIQRFKLRDQEVNQAT
jgi:benzoate-CoA ligase